MPSKENKPMKCECCDLVIDDSFNNHKSTSLHLFHFYIWAFNNRKKAFCKDKEGIRLEVVLLDMKKLGLDLKYHKNKGKYTVKVKPEQLNSANKLEFRCCIYNDRREEDIFLTAARTLDASCFSSCYDDKEDWIESGKFIQIKPKERYKGVVIKFHIENLIVGSYKIPFAFNLQSQEGTTNITISRSIIIDIVGSEELEDTSLLNHKSPFTNKAWDKIVNIIQPYKRLFHLENYTIPPEYARCFKYGFREWSNISMEDYEKLETLRKQMEPGHLTSDNYQNFLHYCLWLEEKVETLMLGSYNMENVHMTLQNKAQLKLEVPGLAEKRPSLIAGDMIRIRVHEDHTGYEGYIKTIEDHHIIIDYVDLELLEMISLTPNIELDVAFQLGRLPLERSHQGIDKICSRGIKKLLFPDDMQFEPYHQIYHLKDSDFNNKKMIQNLEQRTAVEKILNCSSRGAPYIVFGPPGTGKTVTIVEAIGQILKQTKKRILVCAPTNAACDWLTSKLIPYCKRTELIRIHSDTRDKSSIPKDILRFSNMTEDHQVLAVSPRDIVKYRIIVTTLIFIGRFSESHYRPDYVFVDEAAQAKEPEICVALSLMKHPGGCIVLAGDPMQLGPVIQSTVAQDYGLNVSLLERLMETQKVYADEDPNFITMLKKHFRSHPDILKIPNDLFYQSKLEASSEQPKKDPVSKLAIYPNVRSLHPHQKSVKLNTGQAIEFCGISSKERREGRSPSYFNPAEANMVLEYIKTLVGVPFGVEDMVKPKDIGVITPYIRQVYKIKELLRKNNYQDVEVGSTEAFQGREKRVIIISTVRAQHSLLKYDKKYTLGFVKQAKRFNVAITRAVSKIVVIGCPAVLAQDNKWRDYILKCKEMKSYHGAQYEPRTREKMEEIIERFRNFPNFVEKKQVV